MDKGKIIIAVTRDGRQVEQLSREILANEEKEKEFEYLKENNNYLQAKILQWYAKTKDQEFAVFMDIKKQQKGLI